MFSWSTFVHVIQSFYGRYCKCDNDWRMLCKGYVYTLIWRDLLIQLKEVLAISVSRLKLLYV